ncbi:hypothetical protein C0J52_19724, partial [Blattella germanica]
IPTKSLKWNSIFDTLCFPPYCIVKSNKIGEEGKFLKFSRKQTAKCYFQKVKYAISQKCAYKYDLRSMLIKLVLS